MSKKDLRKYLEKLRAEVRMLEKSDELIREWINRLINDVEHHHDTARRANLLKNIRDSIGQFEAGHPRLTGILIEKYKWLEGEYWGGKMWIGGYFVRSVGAGLT